MKSYKIHLIRHGITEANEKGLYIGRTDLPLSPAGLAALLQMKNRGDYPSAARYYTSPLTRCRQTLEVLYPGCRPILADGLSECDFGRWDGKSVTSLQQDADFRDWIAGKRQEIPEGEDAASFQRRVTKAFEEVVNSLMHTGETEAVICTSGGVIMMIMAAYALPRAQMHEWAADSGCGYTLRITPSLWMREPVAEAVAVIPAVKEEA